jgi:hypothetical protein
MRSRGTKQLSRPKAAAALHVLLYGCRDENLAGFTPEGLSASYNVPIAKAAQMLETARKARAA